MGTHFKPGFTIIETMLVLAITGVLVSSLLVGIGGTINGQRYKDSVSSFRALIQEQYGLVDNVSNDRDAGWTCDSNAKTTEDTTNPILPGQSDCVLLGRYMSVVNDTITTASIVGFQKSTSANANDIAAITTNYELGISTSSIENSQLEWGAQIAWPSSGYDKYPTGPLSPAPPSRGISILIIRSPQSETAYTFTSNVVYSINSVTSANLTSMMIVGNVVPGQMQRFICIDPSAGSGLLTSVPEKLSVSIGQAASDASGIETRSTSTNTTLGVASAC